MVEINPEAIKDLFDDIAQTIRAALEPVAAEYAGRPVEEIVPAVDSALRQVGVEGADPAPIAQAISAGEPIEVNLS